jgi:protein-tyrosine phosphatase
MKYGIIFLGLGTLLLAGLWLWESLTARGIASYSALNFWVLGVAYLLRFPAIWMKRRDGVIHPVSFGLLLPLHLLNWISFLLATRVTSHPARHEVAPNLWLGRRPSAGEAKTIQTNGKWAVVDMTSEFQEVQELRTANYLCLPTLDHTAPTPKQIENALSFIQVEIRQRPVLVHCALGHGRSATVAAAWMLRNGLAKSPEDADQKLRAIRAGVRLKAPQLRLLTAMFPGLESNK